MDPTVLINDNFSKAELCMCKSMIHICLLQSFSTQLGEMRQKFGMFDSPLSFILVTSHGGRESCRGALQMLRSRGVSVDEAYCLAGAPRGPMLSLVQPHFLLRDGYSGLEE